MVAPSSVVRVPPLKSASRILPEGLAKGSTICLSWVMAVSFEVVAISVSGISILKQWLTEGNRYFMNYPGLEVWHEIATGTPEGVGGFRKTQVFMDPGDVVIMEIDQLGKLGNPIVE